MLNAVENRTPVTVQPLAFETGIYGRPVAWMQVAGDVEPGELDALLELEKQAWRANGQLLVGCRLAGKAEQAVGRILEKHGFRRIESLVTFERALDPAEASGPSLPEAVPEDHQACIEIGGNAFAYDRFHADARLPGDGADRLKSEWVANSLKGRADAVLVARTETGVAGFIAMRRIDDAAVIDLVAVASHARGRGLGKTLVCAALTRYAGRCARMRVGTQRANNASVLLYRGCGFAEVAQAGTWHWVGA